MKYNYTINDELKKNSVRKVMSILGKKNKETKRPEIIPNSHEEMIRYLRKAYLSQETSNPKIIDALKQVNRINFFSWESQTKELKQQMVTPFSFMAPVFAKNQTVPSPHILVDQMHSLNFKESDKVLEIGTGSGYNIALVSKIVGNTQVYTTEIDLSLLQIAEANLKKIGLENKVNVFLTEKNKLGLEYYAPYNKIYSTVAARTTKQIENLLDQLENKGLLRISVVKQGNFIEKAKAKLWEPGMNINYENIFIKDAQRGFARQATYIFRKDSHKNVSYSIIVENALGPLLKE